MRITIGKSVAVNKPASIKGGGLLLTVILSAASPVWATEVDEAPSIVEAFANGKAKLNFRYRYEFVDQDGLPRDANASTLRSRLSWTSATYSGFTWGAEADHVTVVGDERFNSTNNGRASFPVVADPEGFDLNQAYIKYSSQKLNLTGGRQRINFADQRFVGGVGWRQNEQTYDAFRAQYKANERVALDYTYVWAVNRLFGPDNGAQPADWDGDTHLLNLDFKIAQDHSLKAFAYLLDFENDNGPVNSTSTYGVTYSGKLGGFNLNAGYATQKDYKDSPLNYEADYFNVDAGYKLGAVTLKAGYEVLGSDDGIAAFRTPLATLHKFQGFADKFLTTPADGIKDLSVGLAGKVGKLSMAATWHDFDADEGSTDYGSEINLVATYPLSKRTTALFKFADYDADEFATDTTKVWFMINVNL